MRQLLNMSVKLVKRVIHGDDSGPSYHYEANVIEDITCREDLLMGLLFSGCKISGNKHIRVQNMNSWFMVTCHYWRGKTNRNVLMLHKFNISEVSELHVLVPEFYSRLNNKQKEMNTFFFFFLSELESEKLYLS